MCKVYLCAIRPVIALAIAGLSSSCGWQAERAARLDGHIRMLGDPTTSGIDLSRRRISQISRENSDRARTDYVELSHPAGTEANPAKPFEFDQNGEKVSLNFVDAPIQDFVRIVFDEIMKEPVIVDASLKGRVTVRTQSPVSRKVAFELVRQALQATGATLVKSVGAYRVSAQSGSKAGRQAGDSARVIPLQFITANEAKNALGAFGQSGVNISIGPDGHFLVLSGLATDLDNIEQALGSLDVDQMKGMSFGLFPLKEAGAVPVANELTQVFGRPQDPRAFRALPIDRMNAVLVVSLHANLVKKARTWLRHLDRADRDGRKIYVYAVQNRRAPDIARILSSVLDNSEDKTKTEAPNRTVAPTLTATSGSTSGSLSASTSRASTATPISEGIVRPARLPGMQDEKSTGPHISADTATNSIVVTATVDEWRIIQSALRRLDVMAPQVLIEATIAEVTLNDTLSHGVQWYFEQGNHTTILTNSATADTAFGAGFNYAFGVPKARIVLNALEQVTDVAIVSSPTLTVLDNQTAKLQVGDQVPITTQSAVSVTTAGAPVVNNIEYKDTGVILSVTPRVNASGLVVLDITQEVSEVVPTTTSSLDSPTIRQRRLNSSIAVYSGMDIVLGGLISLNRSKSDNGVPKAMDIPIIGNLFKSKAKRESARTELLVILRPTVMSNRADIQNITNEIKARMAGMARSLRH